MDKVHVIFGSTTGMTEAVATKIAAEFGVSPININAADASAFDAELLVLGSSTWGIGDLQDDWAAQLDAVKSNFAGKRSRCSDSATRRASRTPSASPPIRSRTRRRMLARRS